MDFQPETLEKLLLGDKILVKACGVGLKLTDFPDIKVMNMNPSVLEALNPKLNGEKLEVPVAHIAYSSIGYNGLRIRSKPGVLRRLRHANV